MARLTDDEFTYFIKILDDTNERYYLKSTIDEQNHTILIHLTNFKHGWVGTLNEEEVKILARRFPTESKDSFYSHTQRAFSKGNKAEIDGRTYVFNCKKLDKNRLEFVWKEKIEALNSLKTIGTMELQERPAEEIASKIMDYTIDEMETLHSANEQKVVEIQRINGQLTKALETIKRTVDLKEKLENDLYHKFVLVLNSKKAELAKLKRQLESYENEHSKTRNGNEHSHDAFVDSHARSTSPLPTITTTTLNDIERPRNKRARHQMSDTDTSGNEEIQQLSMPTQSKFNVDNRHDSSLDLGDDQMDYKKTTVSKHHQRRKYVTGANSISTRPFVNHAGVPSTMATPSLPDDSQTTESLLNKI